MKITKTSSGSYRAVVALGTDLATGKRIIKTFTGKSQAEVNQKVRDAEQRYDQANGTANSFYNAALAFIKSRELVVSPNTLSEYQSRLGMLRGAAPAFCDKKVYDITTDDIQDVLGAFLKPHTVTFKRANAKGEKEHAMGACSPKTIHNYYHFINSVLKYKNIFVRKPKLPSKQRPDLYVPSDAEMKVILGSAEGELLTCIQLASFGPMREGEVCALGIEDIKGNIVHVHKDIIYHRGGGYSIKNTPKTSMSNRFIEFPEYVIFNIRQRGYVTKYNPKELRYDFQKLLRKCEIHEFRFHDLRHFGVSTLHAQGIPDAYIMRRGGWSTDSTLKNVYRHTLADQDRIMTKKALEHFELLG